MKRRMMMMAAAALVCAVATAGWLHTDELIVAAGATNAVAEFALGAPRGGNETFTLDRAVAANISGPGTGTVSFAAIDAGISVALETTASLSPGGTSAIYPRRLSVLNGVTNAEPFTARSVRVTVYQSVTNSAPTRYRFGILTR